MRNSDADATAHCGDERGSQWAMYTLQKPVRLLFTNVLRISRIFRVLSFRSPIVLDSLNESICTRLEYRLPLSLEVPLGKFSAYLWGPLRLMTDVGKQTPHSACICEVL